MITELFQEEYFKIILSGALVAFIAGILGVFVTLKKQAFLSDGIAHASLSGIAVAVFLGFTPIPFAITVGVLMSIAITYFKSKSRISYDSLIGILYTFLFAIGVIFLEFSGGDAHELEEFLIGDIYSVEWVYIISLTALLIVLGLFVFLNYKKLAYSTFDEEAALVRGVKTKRYEYVINILLAIFIILGIKSVGLIMITALLIIPAIFSKYFSKSFHMMIPVSIIFSLVITVISIIVSLAIDLPASSIIVASQSTFLFISLVLRQIKIKKAYLNNK